MTTNGDSPARTVSCSLELDLLKSSISCWGGSGSAGTCRRNLRSVVFIVAPFRMASATLVHVILETQISILLRDVFSLTATSTACSVSGSDTSCKYYITRGELNLQLSLHHFIKRLELCYQCACVRCCMGRGRIKGFKCAITLSLHTCLTTSCTINTLRVHCNNVTTTLFWKCQSDESTQVHSTNIPKDPGTVAHRGMCSGNLHQRQLLVYEWSAIFMLFGYCTILYSMF